MTPRETLEREATVILHGMCRDRHGAAKAISDNLSNYAIGRWVSVEERLPKEQQTVIVKWSDGSISNYVYHTGKQWSVYSHQSYITHWLDLDLPKQPNEKGE